jgi:ABC-2 type transport system permease protein
MRSPFPEVKSARTASRTRAAEQKACPWSALWPLYKKEALAYFNSPVAYIVSLVFLSITGYFFAQPLFLANLSSLDTFTDMAPLLLVFFMPAVTMRLYAEEHKEGTFELLSTFPVASEAVLVAKFLAAVTLLAFALAGTLAYPLTIAALGRLDWGAAFGIYLGLFLTGSALAAAGLFTSTLTRNQIVAFVLAFLIGFGLYVVGKLAPWTPEPLMPLVSFLGVDAHMGNLGRGVLDSRDLLYYASLIGLFLFLSHVSISTKRK